MTLTSIVLCILLYIVGCFFCYWRLCGSLARLIRADSEWKFLKAVHGLILLYVLFSWIGFLGATGAYFADKEEYFFKFTARNHM